MEEASPRTSVAPPDAPPDPPAPGADPAPPSVRARRGRALAWPAALAALVVAPFVTALAGVHTLAFRDTAQIFLPTRSLVTAALRAGRLPLWNPYEGMGEPLFGEGIHGALHPLSLLAAFVDPNGIDVLLVLYLVAAALGAFVLARELGLDRAAAFVAGAGFALSGHVVSMLGYTVFLAGAASAPWQIAALSAAGRGARYGVPLAALATGATLLSGDAQMAAVAAALGGAIALERGGRRGLGRAAAATGVGLLVASVQLVATAVSMERSTRGWTQDSREAVQWALSPWRLVELVSPGFFMQMKDWDSLVVYRWLGKPSLFPAPYSHSIHVGVPVLALAAAAPYAARRVRLLAAAAAALLWLALGHYAGATQAFSRVPVWGQFRYTEKLVAPLALVLALLAAYGAARLAEAPAGRRRVWIAAGAAAAVALAANGVAWLVASAPPDPWSSASPLTHLRANLAAGLPHALGGALAISLAMLLRRPAWRRVAVGAAVAGSLLLAVRSASHLGDPGAFRASPRAMLAADPPGPRLQVPYGILAYDMYPAADLWDLENCLASRLAVPAWNVRDRIDQVEGYGPFDYRRATKLWIAVANTGVQYYRRYGATHVALPPPRDKQKQVARLRATEGARHVATDEIFGIEYWEVPHRAWALFPREVVAVDGPSAALERLREDLVARSDEVVVESTAQVPAGSGRVLSVRRDTEAVLLQVEADSDALLVVNDTFFPGWTARVDGRPVPILAADVIVRGVVVPAGRHTVEMTYEPAEVRWGLAASGVGLAAVAALAAVARRRRGPEPVTGGGKVL